MKEIWKDIKDYEGLYQVSNLGRVKSLAREVKYFDGNNAKTNHHTIKEKIKNLSKKENGYYRVSLYKDNKVKHFHIHRLVASAFLDNPNKANNCVDNLEWCSYLDNNAHARENLHFKSGKKINIKVTNIINGSVEIVTDLLKWCKQNKHDRASVYKVLSGKYKQHHNLIFAYIN